MSCNGCRVLRKRCSEDCILRTSLQWLPTPAAQSNATLFLAKFFGRADLMSFISAVPHHQRSALFQSLLFEACGRTINPVSGAVGLLCSGNWRICQVAVEAVLSGGVLRPIAADFLSRMLDPSPGAEYYSKSATIECGRVDFRQSDLSLTLVGGGRETTPFESEILSEGSFQNVDDGERQKRKLLDLFV